MDSFNYKTQRPSNFDALADPDIAIPLRIKTKTPPAKNTAEGITASSAPTTVIPQNTVKVVKSTSTNCLDITGQLNNLYSELGKSNSEISEIKSLVNNFKLVFELLTNKSFVFTTKEEITVWTIEHKKKSVYLVYFLVDSDGIEIFPDEVQVVDGDILKIKFTAPQSGTVNLLFF